MKSLSFAAACALLVGGTVGANAATFTPYVVTLEQVGSNVVATGSGEFDLDGLSLLETTNDSGNIAANEGAITSGTGDAYYYSGVSGPTDFGVGSSQGSSSDSGDVVGVNGLFGALLVPTGYTSGTLLSNTSVWDNATFASLGVTPGTYTWTWTAAIDPPDQSFTLDVVSPTATPLPAALPLFAGGLSVLGLFGWRRKRKFSAIAA